MKRVHLRFNSPIPTFYPNTKAGVHFVILMNRVHYFFIIWIRELPSADTSHDEHIFTNITAISQKVFQEFIRVHKMSLPVLEQTRCSQNVDIVEFSWISSVDVYEESIVIDYNGIVKIIHFLATVEPV
jgi:hypothetical protein